MTMLSPAVSVYIIHKLYVPTAVTGGVVESRKFMSIVCRKLSLAPGPTYRLDTEAKGSTGFRMLKTLI